MMMRWSIHSFALCGTITMLAACAHSDPPNPADTVRDRDAAIRIAKTACNDPSAHGLNGIWFAELHDGRWDVRYHVKRSSPGCDIAHVHIAAIDGKPDDCEMCVVTS
jgi:hypothetical protein